MTKIRMAMQLLYFILGWRSFFAILPNCYLSKKSFKINRYIQDDTRDNRLLCNSSNERWFVYSRHNVPLDNFDPRYTVSCELEHFAWWDNGALDIAVDRFVVSICGHATAAPAVVEFVYHYLLRLLNSNNYYL